MFTHLHLVPILRISVAIPLLPIYGVDRYKFIFYLIPGTKTTELDVFIWQVRMGNMRDFKIVSAFRWGILVVFSVINRKL
jgi:hypothetical protein